MGSKSLPANVTAQELESALSSRSDIRLLDVRTHSEFRRVHIAGAHNVPLHEIDQHAAALGGIRAPIVLICRSGARARTAEAVLRRSGARRLHVLQGGMLAWSAQGLATNGRPFTIGGLFRSLLGLIGVAPSGTSAAPHSSLPTDTRSTVRALIEGRAGIDTAVP